MNRVLTNYPNYSVSSTGDVYSNPLTFKDSIGRTDTYKGVKFKYI